jgi:hypothetical protein
MTTGTLKIDPNSTGVYTIAVGHGGGGGSGILSNGTGITRVPPHVFDDSYINHQIQGQTIFAEYILPPNYLGMTEAEIKGLLIEKLVHEMYRQKNIEFTQMKRVETDEMVYRARIHVVPDTHVRIIRQYNKV